MTPYMLTFKPGGKVLELGGGNNPLRDSAGNRITFNVDAIAKPDVDLVHDLSVFPWPLEAESWDGVFAKYCLEHIEFRKVPVFIKEVYHIMRKGGKAIFFVPNTLEQCKKIVKNGVTEGNVEMLFGSQEFPDYGGVHKTGFSPEYAKKLFTDAGFGFVKVFPHPETVTDMIIECHKIPENEVFEREYFESGTIGYLQYRDFATHHSTARKISEMKPSSVLDVGGGKGYVVRYLENHGHRAVCMDISRHCWHNRATDSFILWDATKIPWSRKIPNSTDSFQAIGDKEFDLTFSINFLEHLPIDKLDDVIREMARVSNRGLHGINMTDMPFEEMDVPLDITHQISESKSWWENKFKTLVPGYDVKIEHPRMLEYERPDQQPPVTVMPAPKDTLVKLNIGSFQDCFYWGWINIDILDLHEFMKAQSYIFLQHDVTKGLPYKQCEIDYIFSSHMIEHLIPREGENFLKECYRVLKYGGKIRISVPDTRLITEKYLDETIMDFRYVNVGVEQAKSNSEAFFSLLTEGHKTAFDKDSLSKAIENAGFKILPDVTPFTSNDSVFQTQVLTGHPSLSLVIECEKI